MNPNLNSLDQFLRLFIGLIGVALINFVKVSGLAMVLTSGITLVLMVTAILKFCPFYHLLGVNTFRQKEN